MAKEPELLEFELGAIKGAVSYDRELKTVEVGFFIKIDEDVPEGADAGRGVVLALQAAYLLLRASGVSVSDIKRGLREVEGINYYTERDGSKAVREDEDGIGTPS